MNRLITLKQIMPSIVAPYQPVTTYFQKWAYTPNPCKGNKKIQRSASKLRRIKRHKKL